MYIFQHRKVEINLVFDGGSKAGVNGVVNWRRVHSNPVTLLGVVYPTPRDVEPGAR